VYGDRSGNVGGKESVKDIEVGEMEKIYSERISRGSKMRRSERCEVSENRCKKRVRVEGE
jgi:hypothetical protein